jgi:hypothetical protein
VSGRCSPRLRFSGSTLRARATQRVPHPFGSGGIRRPGLAGWPRWALVKMLRWLCAAGAIPDTAQFFGVPLFQTPFAMAFMFAAKLFTLGRIVARLCAITHCR